MQDITGTEIVAPPGPLGSFSLFATEKATEDQMSTVLAASGLGATREGNRVLVRRLGASREVALPLDAGGLVGHVAYRSGESAGPAARRPGMEGFLATEATLWGLATNGGGWIAFVRAPDGRDQARRARAALANLRFEWSRAHSARGELERAIDCWRPPSRSTAGIVPGRPRRT